MRQNSREQTHVFATQCHCTLNGVNAHSTACLQNKGLCVYASYTKSNDRKIIMHNTNKPKKKIEKISSSNVYVCLAYIAVAFAAFIFAQNMSAIINYCRFIN